MPRPIHAKKHLGQNFLINPSVTERILTSAGLQSADTLIEIGPGKGVLTRHLPRCVAAVYAVEKDPRLAEHLKEDLSFDNLHVIEGDFLELDLSRFGDPLKVLGNIPYNLSTPIVEKLVASRNNVTEACLTVQKEFAGRLTAKADTKDYGALSCYLQYYADVTKLFDIHPKNFRPAPKVFSSFIRIHFRPPEQKAANEERLFKLIRHVFTHRRKKITNTLGGIVPKEDIQGALERCGISESKRPDQIGVGEYVLLSNVLEGKNRAAGD